jgi:hypothetical protein
MTDDERRFDALLDFALDGSLSDAEQEEFARLVDAHPEWTRGLAEELMLHSLLQWQGENVASDLAFFAVPTTQEEHVNLVHLASQTSSARSPFMILQRWPVLVAALALVVGALLTWQAVPLGHVDRLAVASVVDQDNVVWSNNSAALYRGDQVSPGRLESESGSYTLQFCSGPTVRVSGPASMMIESDMLVHLDRGQATAQVPKPLKGFTMRTPVVNVVDQGTEFGVAARASGVTDVVVFDGRVDLVDSITGSEMPKMPKSLVRGEAARVDRNGSVERIMQVGRNDDGHWWTNDDPAASHNLIRSVRDNIPAGIGSNYFCFQITNQGVKDDAFAYADHPHQWNGLTAAGLPQFLRGAEYVQTFNDYRYMRYLQIVVELARPANLYVFFDDRSPTPDWLDEQFVDTGVNIGLDEGPDTGIPDHVVAVGGGQSIDNVFSVWKRRCEGPSRVVLGGMIAGSEARAMYGIAATSLDADNVADETSSGR